MISEYLSLNETLLGKEVDMGESPFAEKFIVRSQEPERARQIVSESLQAVILEHKLKPAYDPVEIAIGPGDAVLLRVETTDPRQWHDLIDFARQIESAME